MAVRRAAGLSAGPGVGSGRANPPTASYATLSPHPPGKCNGGKEFSNTFLNITSVPVPEKPTQPSAPCPANHHLTGSMKKFSKATMHGVQSQTLA